MIIQASPSSSDGKESVYNAGFDSIPGSGRSPGEGNGNSSILAWRVSWTEESGRLHSMGHKKSDTTEQLTLYVYINRTAYIILSV